MERGALRRALGTARREPERAASARGRPRALGGLQSARSSSCATGCGTLARGTEGAEPPASILLLGGDVHCSSIHEVDLGGGRVVPRAPARLLALPQPALAEGAAHRAGDRLARLASSSSHDSRSWPASRRRPRAGSRSARRPSTTPSASSCSTVARRPRRSGGARARARIRSYSSPIRPSRSPSRRGNSGPRSIPHPACARNGRKNGGPERARPRRSISPRPLRPGTLSTVCRQPCLRFDLPPELAEIRAAVRELCARFPGEYWRGARAGWLSRRSSSTALTESGWLGGADPRGVRRRRPRPDRGERDHWRRSTPRAATRAPATRRCTRWARSCGTAARSRRSSICRRSRAASCGSRRSASRSRPPARTRRRFRRPPSASTAATSSAARRSGRRAPSTPI